MEVQHSKVVVKIIGLLGLTPRRTDLEIRFTKGLFMNSEIIGAPGAVVRETKLRVAAALAEHGLPLEDYSFTVQTGLSIDGHAFIDERNPSRGTCVMDLAIAVGILAAFGRVPLQALERTFVVGELSLSGRVRPVRGISAMLTKDILKPGWDAIVPEENAIEAGFRPKLTNVFLVGDLGEVIQHLQGKLSRWAPFQEFADDEVLFDMSDLPPGLARRGLEVAAAGGHNMLLVGPPGSGKTMVARRLTSILPEASDEEMLERIRIHSIAGILPAGARPKRSRPFRAPHYTVSNVGLVGGGAPFRPGEVSLAHHGVLFLDEVVEFHRSTLEGLHQPLREGTVTHWAGGKSLTVPARAQVVAAMNACPCGYKGNGMRTCNCSDERVASYVARVVPLDPYIDLRIPLLSYAIPSEKAPRGETSLEVRARVEKARARQLERQKEGRVSVPTNGQLPPEEAERLAGGISQYPSLTRVARTLADLDDQPQLEHQHILEASLLTINWIGDRKQ